MEDNKELLQALNGIQAELQRINKTLGDLAAQKSRAAAPAMDRPAGRPRLVRQAAQPPVPAKKVVTVVLSVKDLPLMAVPIPSPASAKARTAPRVDAPKAASLLPKKAAVIPNPGNCLKPAL
jgi:hypothetical protein